MTGLKGKVAVVTGAPKGIGAAIPKRPNEAGASVEFEREMIGGTPLGRIGQSDDIARIAVSWPLPTLPGSPASAHPVPAAFDDTARGARGDVAN
jgi:hypothetical protein